VGLTVLFLGVLSVPLSGWARPADISTAATWSTVYSDSFTTLSPVWTITDDTEGQYQWGVTPYTVEVGTMILEGSGLWAAGGGAVGQTQTWPTGTYTNSMTTWAIAGPFTLTQKVWDMHLQVMGYNDMQPGDELFIGLSADGVNFTGITSTVSTLALQTLDWSTRAYSTSEAVWIGLRFTSGAEGLAAGPLVDNLTLAFNYGASVYLPLVRRDPTPTPTLAPTLPPYYFDRFNDPASGWYVGDALRYNTRCYFDGTCFSGWEVVANMSYVEDNYQIHIPTSFHGGAGTVDTWFVHPAFAAPMPSSLYPLPQRYCIEARGKFASSKGEYDPWWTYWGIVFAADASMTNFYSFMINANHDYAITEHINYVFPGNRRPDGGEYINVQNYPVAWTNRDLDELIPTMVYNTLKVVVDGPLVSIYANGVHLETVSLGTLQRQRVGIIGGVWEITPVDLWFDYFRYVPNCP
jgi:hypothetical protein